MEALLNFLQTHWQIFLLGIAVIFAGFYFLRHFFKFFFAILILAAVMFWLTRHSF